MLRRGFRVRGETGGLAKRRERVAQLVRQRREELVLAPVGGEQRVLRGPFLRRVAKDEDDARRAPPTG